MCTYLRLELEPLYDLVFSSLVFFIIRIKDWYKGYENTKRGHKLVTKFPDKAKNFFILSMNPFSFLKFSVLKLRNKYENYSFFSRFLKSLFMGILFKFSNSKFQTIKLCLSEKKHCLSQCLSEILMQCSDIYYDVLYCTNKLVSLW
jgi:hypothetical protein